MAEPRDKRDRSLLKQRPELVNRFIRIQVLRKCRAFGRWIARRRARRMLLKEHRKRVKALSGALATCCREGMRARRHRLGASETVYNLALYFLIAERDIQTLKIDALTHPDAWTRSLCARVILLTIHELDLDKAGGSRLRTALELTDVPTDLRQEVTSALRAIRSAQQKAQKLFASLRDSAIAHQDADAISRYNKVAELDSLAIVQTAADFYAGTHAFMDVMPRLIEHVAGIKGVIAQLSQQLEQPRP